MSFAQPSWPKVLPDAVVVGLATLGPIGRRLPAPGTWGSLAGLGFFWVGFRGLSPGWMLAVSAVAAYGAVAICGEAEERLRKKDPGEVILDEFVAMPLCFLGWPTLIAGAPVPAWAVGLAGFALFRVFDILKPFGIARLQSLRAGLGVVVDDLAAALAAGGVMHLAIWIWNGRL